MDRLDLPNIYHFIDHRAYLKAHFDSVRARNRRWSLGAWASKLKVPTASLTRVLSGERDLGPEMTERLLGYFAFKGAEAEYFRDLVALKRIDDRTGLCSAVLHYIPKKHPYHSLQEVNTEGFHLLSAWYAIPVWLSIRLRGLKQSPAHIAARFRQAITPAQVRRTIENLISVGLLASEGDGRLKTINGRMKTTNDIPSEAIKSYHTEMLAQAQNAIREVPVEEREFSASVLVINQSNLPKAKALVREFREKMGELLEESEGDSLYQFQTQLFPLTRSEAKADDVPSALTTA